MNMRRFLLLVFFMILSGTVSSAVACEDPKAAQTLFLEAVSNIRKLNDEITRINASGKSAKSKEKKIKVIRTQVEAISKKLFDYELLGSLTLVHHWKQIQKSQKEEFIHNFREILESKMNQSQKKYTPGSPEEKAEKIRQKSIHYLYNLKTERSSLYQDALVLGRTVCRIYTTLPGADVDTNLDFLMVKEKDRLVIYDLYIDDNSLILDYRRVFNRTIAQKGLTSFLQDIREKARQISAAPAK